jgi:hypothetical protein
LITREDIIGMCGLTEAEIEAIAEHEHIHEVGAAALADYLLRHPHGAHRIHEILCEDMREAMRRGDAARARELWMALEHFLAGHPEGVRG